jgi:hypothetical protein
MTKVFHHDSDSELFVRALGIDLLEIVDPIGRNVVQVCSRCGLASIGLGDVLL